jgi:hypothetical protein
MESTGDEMNAEDLAWMDKMAMEEDRLQIEEDVTKGVGNYTPPSGKLIDEDFQNLFKTESKNGGFKFNHFDFAHWLINVTVVNGLQQSKITTRYTITMMGYI